MKRGTPKRSPKGGKGQPAAGRTSPLALGYIRAAGGGIYSDNMLPGGIPIDGTITIVDSTVSDNEATIAINGHGGPQSAFGGGLALSWDEHAFVTSSTFSGN